MPLDPFFGSIVGAGMDLLGGALSGSASAKAAKNQREWEQHMYQNRYRMAMKDLKRAGLNPIMAVGGGLGAGSVPSGATAEAGQLGAAVARSGRAIHSALELRTMQAMADKAESEAEKAAIDAHVAKHSSDYKTTTLDIRGSGLDPRSRLQKEIDLALESMSASAAEKRSHAGLYDELARLPDAQIRQINNAIGNRNLDDLTRLLVETGLAAAGNAAAIARSLLMRRKGPGIIFQLPRRTQ